MEVFQNLWEHLQHYIFTNFKVLSIILIVHIWSRQFLVQTSNFFKYIINDPEECRDNQWSVSPQSYKKTVSDAIRDEKK